jgi:hypothetical protein
MNKSTDEATSHLTKLANYANQVIGYVRFKSGVALKVRNPLPAEACVELSARYSLLAYRSVMSRSPRSVRLALEAAAATRYWQSRPFAGAAASCHSRTGCFATPCQGNLSEIHKGVL